MGRGRSLSCMTSQSPHRTCAQEMRLPRFRSNLTVPPRPSHSQQRRERKHGRNCGDAGSDTPHRPQTTPKLQEWDMEAALRSAHQNLVHSYANPRYQHYFFSAQSAHTTRTKSIKRKSPPYGRVRIRRIQAGRRRRWRRRLFLHTRLNREVREYHRFYIFFCCSSSSRS